MKNVHEWFEISVDFSKLHDKFKFLLNPQYTSERELFQSWISEFQIKDGVSKTIKQFQETFHSVFWEVYLNQVFVESGFELGNTVSPDFCLFQNDKKIFVEAVVSNIANNEPKENERTLEDIYGENDYYSILDESITRLYNSFCNKKLQYNEQFLNIADIDCSPFVLAIGDYAQINYGQSYYYPLLALLYGAYYDKDDIKNDLKILCEDNFGNEYKFCGVHKKKNGTELKIGIFNEEENSNISAVIYSCTTSLGKLSSLSEDHIPYEKCILVDREFSGHVLQKLRYSKQQPDETLHDGLFVYHNPNAKNKLPDDFLNKKGVVHFRYDEDAETALNISFNSNGILKRRQVCMKGTEAELIKNFKDFIFLPMVRT